MTPAEREHFASRPQPNFKTADNPSYPAEAAIRGQEGFVIAAFSVSGNGRVRDAHVVESEPPGTFDEATLAVVRSFVYEPITVDGYALIVPERRVRFVFRMQPCTGPRLPDLGIPEYVVCAAVKRR